MAITKRPNHEKEKTASAAPLNIRSLREGRAWELDCGTGSEEYEFDMPPAYSVEDPQRQTSIRRKGLDRPPSYRERPFIESLKGQSCVYGPREEGEYIEEEDQFDGNIYWDRPVGLGSDHDRSSSDDSDDDNSVMCLVTREGNKGFTLSDDYIWSLEDEQDEIHCRLSEAEAQLLRFRKLYWASRGEYYFSHLAGLDLDESGYPAGSDSDCEDPEEDFEKLSVDGETEFDESSLRKLADTSRWRDIQHGEYHLHGLEREFDDAMEDALMVRAELLICKMNIDVRVPREWRFSDDLDLRVWSATEGTGVVDAEEFLRLPDHKRVLTFNGKRFN